MKSMTRLKHFQFLALLRRVLKSALHFRAAVGPVREAVAECIARLMSSFPTAEFVDVIFKHISALHGMNDDNCCGTPGASCDVRKIVSVVNLPVYIAANTISVGSQNRFL